MSRKQFIVDALNFTRNYTSNLLEQFEAPEHWVHQAHEDTNHAMWCAGHIARTDNFAITLLAPDRARDLEGYAERFGAGSMPQADVAAYPPAAEVLEYLNERRHALLEVLGGLSESDLDQPAPEGAPEFMPTVESIFRLVIWHEGLHAGQASVAHRALGKQPVMG